MPSLWFGASWRKLEYLTQRLPRVSDERSDVEPPLIAKHPLVLTHPTRQHRRALYLRPGTTELVRQGGQRCDAAEAERLTTSMMECVGSTSTTYQIPCANVTLASLWSCSFRGVTQSRLSSNALMQVPAESGAPLHAQVANG